MEPVGAEPVGAARQSDFGFRCSATHRRHADKLAVTSAYADRSRTDRNDTMTAGGSSGNRRWVVGRYGLGTLHKNLPGRS